MLSADRFSTLLAYRPGRLQACAAAQNWCSVVLTPLTHLPAVRWMLLCAVAAAWMSAVWEFVVIICLFAPIRALESYAEKRMVAVWRTYLTQIFITAYTTNKAYFHMQVGCRSRFYQHGCWSCTGRLCSLTDPTTKL
jgi:ABC-type uncharacterized transport system fused permease/ATPase subunit